MGLLERRRLGLMMLYEYEGWDHSTGGEQNVAIESRIGDLKEGILEAETLLAEGRTDWCLGDPKETLKLYEERTS